MKHPDEARLVEAACAAIPKDAPDPITWGQEFVSFPNSVRSKHFNIDVTPWLRRPIMDAVDLPTRIVTLMKPVQSGGSAFGELIMLYWIMFWRGFLQFNWSNDKRADERWDSRLLGILKACAPIARKLEMIDISKGQIDFGSIFFRVQGAFVADNLDSDSVSLQINEEVHSWQAGHLQKARNRSTAVWNFKSLDISNAGVKGDQLDKAFGAGTMQYWEIKCPGCKGLHRMRTKWDDRRPDLGGLRYDAEGSRTGFFEYNYNRIRPTIEFWMPCGYRLHNEDLSTRRALSLGADYSEPTNTGAEVRHRSYTYESVSVDYIDWMDLIKQKHDALRARALGDPEPFRRYKQERECIPYDPNDVPSLNIITTTKGLKKTREGLPGEKLRLFSLDRQQGEKHKGEFPYWWLLIRDFQIHDGKLRSRLVFEGRMETDEQVIDELDKHKCNRWQGVADSGDDTTHVYLFCLQYGINAIKGGRHEYYVHEGGARRIFSPERPLHVMLNRPSMFDYLNVDMGGGKSSMMPDPREPMFWLYSKGGIREQLHWLRTETSYETPEDVSDDYRSHQESEERVESINPGDGSRSYKWIQHRDRNDQFVNEAYIAMQVNQAGMILGDSAKADNNKPKETK